jgi:hypothetical protein
MQKLLGFIEIGLGAWTLATKKDANWRLVGVIEVAIGVWMISTDDGILRPIPSGAQFDPADLKVGTKVEMEHTTNRQIAKQIAEHHLLEDPLYYQKLATIHLD